MRLTIKEGSQSWAPIAYSIDGDYVRDAYGYVVYYIYGRYIYRGNNSNGEIVYNIDGHYIREGNSSCNPVKYFVDGNQIREGSQSWCPVVYNIEF